MRSQNTHPKWWLLYLIFPLLVALFAFDHRLQISTHEHEAMQIGIILLIYALIYWWLKANSRAISRSDQQYYGKSRAIHTYLPQVSEAGKEKRPLIQLPDSEVKGMLSDTFEMDSVDANALSVVDISQQMNKE